MILHWLANPITTLAIGFVLAVVANILTPKISGMIWSKKRTFKSLFSRAAWISEARYLGATPYYQARINYFGFVMVRCGIYAAMLSVFLIGFSFNLPDKESISFAQRTVTSISIISLGGIVALFQYLLGRFAVLHRKMNEYLISSDEAMAEIEQDINKKANFIGKDAADLLIRFARAEVSAADVKAAYPDFVAKIHFHGPLERMDLFNRPNQLEPIEGRPRTLR